MCTLRCSMPGKGNIESMKNICALYKGKVMCVNANAVIVILRIIFDFEEHPIYLMTLDIEAVVERNHVKTTER